MANKTFKRLVKRLFILLVVGYLCWPIALLFIVTGIYDVMRQKYNNKKFLLHQYFMVNGTLTWMFSPLNAFIDIICLPFINKQVYQLNDLPKVHVAEITKILNECPREFLRDAINRLSIEQGRSMLMYKWYGYNVDNKFLVPLFHEKFSTIMTIGVSSFKPQTSTKKHFGWFRGGVRVLINIDEAVDDGAYIDVNNKIHVWKTDGPLYIFDDTILHASYNLTNSTRSCLFIDVVRPSYLNFMIKFLFKCFGYLSVKLPFISRSSNWKIVK